MITVRAWLRRGLVILETWGTLVALGLLPLPATVLAVVLGIATGQLALALGVALTVSLAANIVVGYLYWRDSVRWRFRRRRAAQQAFGEIGDPRTLLITSQDFEAWWTAASSAAREHVAPDVGIRLSSIHIGMSHVFMTVAGDSALAMKRWSGSVDGPNRSDVSIYSVRRNRHPTESITETPLWRTDGTWRDLFEQAWLREGPRDLDTTLCFLDTEAGPSGLTWRVTFQDYDPDDDRIDRRGYHLEDGRLARVENPWR